MISISSAGCLYTHEKCVNIVILYYCYCVITFYYHIILFVLLEINEIDFYRENWIVGVRGEHGPVWSDLIPRPDQQQQSQSLNPNRMGSAT